MLELEDLEEPDFSKGDIVDNVVLDPLMESPLLKNLNISRLQQLQTKTKEHWDQQHIDKKEQLNKILKAPEGDILVHKHSVMRDKKGKDNSHLRYQNQTIELCVLTDPYLFDFIKVFFHYQKATTTKPQFRCSWMRHKMSLPHHHNLSSPPQPTVATTSYHHHHNLTSPP